MNNELLFEKRLYDKACLTNTPISGTFELLPTCNLACKMCYVRLSQNEVVKQGGLRTVEEWLTLARKAKEQGMLFLLLTGGETIMYPRFKELYTELSKMGFILEINSNGTLIDENFVDWIKDIPPRHIKVSLYGSSRDTYKKLCGNAEAFDRVIKGFDLMTTNNVPVFVSVTVTPSNVHDLDEMIAICNHYNFKYKITSYMYPPLRSCGKNIPQNYRLSPYDAAYATFKVNLNEYGEKVIFNRAEQIALGNYKEMYDTIEMSESCMQCRAGTCTFWVTWKGYMTPCAMLDEISIPVMEQDFNDSWKTLGQSIKDIRLPLECSNCKAKEMCYSCAASVFCETKTFNKKPEYLCEMTKHYISIMINYYYKNKKE